MSLQASCHAVVPHLVHAVGAPDPRVVHEHVEAAELVGGAAEHPLGLRRVREIAGDRRMRSALERGQRGSRRVDVGPVKHRYTRAAAREPLRDRAPDPSAATRDDHALPGEVHDGSVPAGAGRRPA